MSIIWCLVLLLVVEATAQVERVLPRRGSATLEGTEFLIGFMENEVPLSPAPVVLRIFLASEFKANVTLSYPNGQVDRYTIAPDQVQVVDADPSLMCTASETAERKAVRITSDVPIVAYALNSRVMSTDTYTAIPVRHFGTEYMVVSRAVDRYRINILRPDPAFDTASRQSEFLILANEDNTSVMITTTAPTERGKPAGIPDVVTLNRGECYLVKGAKGGSGLFDLTGSRISSDKPVGVLSGHVRTSIPRRDVFNKDHLAEMLAPMDKWGSEYVTTPFAVSSVGDVVRVMAAQDGTVVTAQTAAGTTNYTIPNAGGWIEFNNVNYPVRWTSTKPTCVTQFMMSQQMSQSSIMDPAMVIMAPVERFVSRAVFRTPELLPQQNADPLDYEYYFSVVADAEALASLTANGALLTSIDPGFASRVVPGTNLRWASFSLNPATVVMRCDTGRFSGAMYGVGPADSYANIYGMSLDPQPKLELTPPKFALVLDCGHVTGTIADVSTSKPYLQEVVVVAGRTANYDCTISAPIDSIGTVEVDASVRDLTRDARLVIHAWDSLGNGREWEYVYDAPNVSVNAVTIDVTATPACTTLVLHNRDTTPVKLGNVRLTGDPRYRLARPMANITIPARDSLLVEVCLDAPYSPPAAPAIMIFEFGCGLTRTTTVRPLSGVSVASIDVDLGAVRVGDTACGNAMIANNGIDPVVIDHLLLASMAMFSVDTAAMNLPITLRAGDTLLIPVCFTPDAVTTYQRTDTVATLPSLPLTVSYRGRGIRPMVRDVVLDWRQRRVGTRNDSVLTLRNTGEAPCTVVGSVTQTTSIFDVQQLLAGPIAIGAGDSVTVGLAFAPDQRGRQQVDLGYVVDWRYHDTVYVRLRGEGVMPDLTTTTIDMGSVRIDAMRDSLADVGVSTGNERLTIDTMWLEGPDALAFTVGSEITDVRSMLVDEVLSGQIQFAPRRIGRHVAEIVVVHDGAPAYERRTSRIVLTGTGLGLDTIEWNVDLQAAASMPACTDDSISVVIANTGNIEFEVTDVDLMIDGSRITWSQGPALPATVQRGEAQTWTFKIALRLDAGGDVSLRVVRSDGFVTTLQRSIGIVGTPVELVATPSMTLAPGNTVALDCILRLPQLASAITPTMRHDVDVDQLNVTSSTIEAAVTGRTQVLIFDVVRSQRSVTLIPREQLPTPSEIRWTLSGVLLWKDPAPFTIRTVAEASTCSVEGEAETQILTELCGSSLRMVRFGAIPLATVQIMPQPAREHVAVTFEATADMVIDLEILDMEGRQVWREEKIVLKKGLTHCKFNCSTLASGTYRMRVGQGTGVIALPLVIVN